MCDNLVYTGVKTLSLNLLVVTAFTQILDGGEL
jgi:hypothetical protein